MARKPNPNEMESNINFVNTILESHKAPTLKEFMVELALIKSKQHHVIKWLEYEFMKGVERMDLNLGFGVTSYDRNVDCSDYPVFDEKMARSITRSSSFESCLKVFCLRCVEVNGDAIALLVRHCKLLERLMIYRSNRRSDVEIGGTSLKHLDLRSREINHIEENYNIRVCAPNLTWLTVDQNSGRVLLENVPNLVHMNFYCRPRHGDSMFHFANAAAQLQTLIIHISDPMVRFTVPEMPKLKKLVIYVRTNVYSFVPLPVPQFLSASPCLEELKIEISEILFGAFPQFASTPDIFEIPKVGEGCGHKQLKVFVLSGYCGVEKIEEFEFGHCKTSLELVRYIVENSVRLEEIVLGQCDRIGLVRDIVDYGDEPLHNYFIKPAIDHYRFAATPDQRQAFKDRCNRNIYHHTLN
ncbi:uncharacterized protein LOC125195313 [Salvia hispanica]|uniref:uncharacterized protein LOC125195313 n=1 Tax=Salvia hispanica TaxID=49212 RepID=UPI002009CFE0|nr:uncharacterized protein LOC125195313 [Salvia hispanica]